jgi:curved DNA-binding protein CbpA
MPEQNHYAVLGVQPSATQEQIRTQYRLLVKRYHPDLHPGDTAAEEMMGQVNQAYDVLGDPGERRQYDNDLRIAAESESVAGPQSWGQPSSRPGPQASQGGGQQSSWNPQWGAATDPRERQAEAEAMWEAMRARSRVRVRRLLRESWAVWPASGACWGSSSESSSAFCSSYCVC